MRENEDNNNVSKMKEAIEKVINLQGPVSTDLENHSIDGRGTMKGMGESGNSIELQKEWKPKPLEFMASEEVQKLSVIEGVKEGATIELATEASKTPNQVGSTREEGNEKAPDDTTWFLIGKNGKKTT
ncbi:hypothetical protein ACFE04_031092 [Oxalis oulophora]